MPDSRFASIGLAEKSPETAAKWPQVEKGVTDALGQPGRFLTAMIRDGEGIVAKIEGQTKALIQSGLGGRRAAIEAALTVGWYWWSGLFEHVGVDVLEEDTVSDAVTLVQELLGLRLRTFDRGDQSVAKILRAGDAAGLALDYGFRMVDDALEIAPKHASLATLLTRSQWAGVDLRRTLTQIDGVTTRRHPVHFGGVKARVVGYTGQMAWTGMRRAPTGGRTEMQVRIQRRRPHSALDYRPPAPGACNPFLLPEPISQPQAVI